SDISDCLRLPYHVGFTTTAMRHEPPDPFGPDYDTATPDDYPDWRSMSKEELCLTQPYILQGRTIAEETRLLTITSIIRAGQDCGPQLVVVNDNLVAKIYDPLYYEGVGEYRYPENVVWHADSAYSREAAAYRHLNASNKVADLVPAFHGTWTIDVDSALPHGGKMIRATRPVRLILMDHIQGRYMQSIKAQSLPARVRSCILKQCLDAEVRIYHAGVGHHDFSPRNIIIVGHDYNTPILEVKVIDFDLATVYDHSQFTYRAYRQAHESLEEQQHPKMQSPLMRHFGRLAEFSCLGWCPGSDFGGEKWLWQQYRNDTRYRMVCWDPKQPGTDPQYL
ncbi:hypothetical protein EJ07DRAFT_62715, partial [Lizonia empirigonia]